MPIKLPATTPQLPPSMAFSHLPQLSMRMLSDRDFEPWSALRDVVLAALPNPDAYVREEDEYAFFCAHLGCEGQTVGVFHGEELVAYSMVGFPAAVDPENLGAVIGLPPSLFDKVSHISSCMVLPQWRGNGLQRTLLALRMAMAQAHGRPYCLAMVSLHNHRSRHNLMRQGMYVGWTGSIHGLQRHVVCIDLHHEAHFDMEDEQLIDCGDYLALCAAAQNGYVGVGELRAADDRVQLRYVGMRSYHAAGPR